MTAGNTGDPALSFPPNPTLAPPNSVPTGIFEQLDNLIGRIRLAPGYTPEVGGLLGILPASPVRPARPGRDAADAEGDRHAARFDRERRVQRGFSEGVAVEVKIDNAAEWVEAGRFFKSPAALTTPENPQNLPRAVQIHARYVEDNTPVGQYSPR